MSKKEPDQSGKSLAADQTKVVQNEFPQQVANKNQDARGRYHAADLYDLDRYFPRPGTAEYGC